jgi:serine protease Do
MSLRKVALLGTLLVVGLVIGGLLQAQDESRTESGVIVSGEHGPRTVYFVGEGEGGWLGVGLKDVNAERMRELKLPGEYGAIVDRVEKDSPAAKAGLEKDDVILQFGGEKVRSVAELARLVRETPPGRSIELLVSREGKTRNVTVTLEQRGTHFELPAMPPMPVPVPRVEVPEFNFVWRSRGARLGISGDELTSQLAQYFGVKQGKGILVREVVVGSAADKAGLKAGDVIVAVDGKAVATVSELRRALDVGPEKERKVTLGIVRDRHEQNLTVELEPMRQFGPERVTEIQLGMDPAEMKRWAEEFKSQAKELAEQAREWQGQEGKLQQELEEQRQHLQEELQLLRDEIHSKIKEQIGPDKLLPVLETYRRVV